MFTGFNLKIKETFDNYYYDIGKRNYDTMEIYAKKDIDKYIDINETLDATEMKSDWFPEIEADIFISHSHIDEKLAIGLAGWLYDKFGLKSFIDSCVWGYSDKLLKTIDDKYCLSENSAPSYSYEKRNFSTSHVHMMLSTSLTSMIDKTECILFLNTSNSTSTTNDTIKNETNSPWIYSEVLMSKLIRKTGLSQDRIKNIVSTQKDKYTFENSTLEVKYDLGLKHLIELNTSDLTNWDDFNKKYKDVGINALDTLYMMKNVNIYST